MKSEKAHLNNIGTNSKTFGNDENHEDKGNFEERITRHTFYLTKENEKLYNIKLELYDDGKARLIRYKSDRVRPGHYQSKSSKSSKSSKVTKETQADVNVSDRTAYIYSVRRKIQQYARNNDFKYFVTLTFDPKLIEDDNDNYRFEMLKKWLQNERVKSKYRNKEFKYIFVPEYHKNGTIHFHGLIGEYIPELVRAEQAKKETYNLVGWKHGFSMVNKIKSKNRVSSYISKYITKELLDSPVARNKKRYWSSKNLSLPQIELINKDISDLIDIEKAFESEVCDIYELDEQMTKELFGK